MKIPAILLALGLSTFLGKLRMWASAGLTPIRPTERLALLAASAPLACLGGLETRHTAVGIAGSFG